MLNYRGPWQFTAKLFSFKMFNFIIYTNTYHGNGNEIKYHKFDNLIEIITVMCKVSNTIRQLELKVLK